MAYVPNRGLLDQTRVIVRIVKVKTLKLKGATYNNNLGSSPNCYTVTVGDRSPYTIYLYGSLCRLLIRFFTWSPFTVSLYDLLIQLVPFSVVSS